MQAGSLAHKTSILPPPRARHPWVFTLTVTEELLEPAVTWLTSMPSELQGHYGLVQAGGEDVDSSSARTLSGFGSDSDGGMQDAADFSESWLQPERTDTGGHDDRSLALQSSKSDEEA